MNKYNFIIFIVLILIILFMSLCVFPFSSPPEDSVKSLLEQPYKLHPGYKVGDKDFYHIETVYQDMDSAGKVSKTTVLDGHFSREVKPGKDTSPVEKFVWTSVKMGSGKGKGAIQEYKTLPYAENFQYTFGEWTPERFPVDLSSIPKTMEGWFFVVNLIDTHTFDVIVNLCGEKQSLVHMRDAFRLPQEGIPIVMDFPPLFTDTSFENAVVHVEFRGLTLHRGRACAILSFRSDDCRVHMVTHMNEMAFPTEGVSYYSGEIFLSLGDRKIEWGKIRERVDLVTSLGSNSTSKNMTRREITLERAER